MQTVYRYEHKSCPEGPYSFRSVIAGDLIRAHTNFVTHPVPNPRLVAADGIFGCETLDRLLEWFDGFHSRLFAKGFHIVEYQSEEVTFAGGEQVVIGNPRHITNVFTSVEDAQARAS